MKIAKMMNSVFNWEDSYFGGYERVIYDHPSIYIPPSIDVSFDKNPGLTFYTATKLCNLFLLKCMKYNLYRTLLVNSKVKERANWIGKKETVTVFDKRAIQQCAVHLSMCGDPLENMFGHYLKFLREITIEYIHPSEEDKKKSLGSTSSFSISDEMAKEFLRIKENTPFSWGRCDSVSGDLKDSAVFQNAEDKDRGDWSPSVEETKLANGLVNLLDISFDPTEDRISNLKCGKMSPHKVAEIPAGNTHIYYRVEHDQNTKPFSVCILCDESGSMRAGSLDRKQNHLVKVLFAAFSQIMPKSKIYVYGHSGPGHPVIRVYNDQYNPCFEDLINSQLHQDYDENYDGPAIECVYERVRQQTSDNILFISISDGEPAGVDYGGKAAIEDLQRVIEKCKRDGFVTMGIGLLYHKVKDIYNYHTVISDTKHLVKNVSSLINRVVRTEFKS